jgi:hypothetical protein
MWKSVSMNDEEVSLAGRVDILAATLKELRHEMFAPESAKRATVYIRVLEEEIARLRTDAMQPEATV